jgi:proteasome assembly chaperone (PAC2) family protein
MTEQGIHIDTLPELEKPVLIAGFDGWGNALNISQNMVTYLVRKLKAESFAKINPDLFHRYDESRPLVNIEEGDLKSISTPGGSFYFSRTGAGERDLVFLKADEPALRWFHFVSAFLILCKKLNVDTIITLGSMYDHVLHSDRIVSGIASSEALFSKLKQKKVITINYQGPAAIHSLIHSECLKRGLHSISLWCHCPYYLQNVMHFGILSHLGTLLSFLGEFTLDVEELEKGWKDLKDQIQLLIEKSPETKTVVDELRKAKVRGSRAGMRNSATVDEKVINLKDFLEPG